ncbi:MAG: RluA family pseudouridine synthase [Micavibrio aeruginosavorus]|nr:RluA family pseudouridine synthase [Micavibrio aeruginosavorus]
MSGVKIVTVAQDDDGQRLDRWLKKNAPDLPYALLQKLMRKGQIRVDGKRAKTDTRLAAGQEVRIPPSSDEGKQDRYFRAQKGDAELLKSMILYDDGDLMVLNKPAGIAAQGGLRVERHIDGLLEHMADAEGSKPKLCHRLDRDTSGLLVLARSREMAAKMGKAFENKNIRKYYWALVAPAPEENEGSIVAPLAKGADSFKDMMVVDEENGKFARTEFKVIERAAKKAAFLALWPRTGRTHQLRVHCQAAGFPIIGDEKYGNDDAAADMVQALGLAPRLHLHAARLILPHPGGKGVLDLRAPLPPELRKSWGDFGFDYDFSGDPFADVRL